jgi:hypothetical protein
MSGIPVEVPAEDFEKSVFINCPFDRKYRPLLNSIVFAVHDIGFLPRSALEKSNFRSNRLETIIGLISSCKYSIHDISRTEPDPRTKLPRFNMPLELGLDLGCSIFGDEEHQEKVLLVMDEKKLRYRQFISDIAGQEIYAHGNSEENVINIVREWLSVHQLSVISQSDRMFQRYRAFQQTLPAILKNYGWTRNPIPFKVYSYVAARWLDSNRRTQLP